MVYTQKKAEGGNMMEDDDTPANWGYPSIINFHTNIKSPQSGSRQLRLSPPNNDLPVQGESGLARFFSMFLSPNIDCR